MIPDRAASDAAVPAIAATVMMARKVSGEIVVVAMCIVQGPGGIAGQGLYPRERSLGSRSGHPEAHSTVSRDY